MRNERQVVPAIFGAIIGTFLCLVACAIVAYLGLVIASIAPWLAVSQPVQCINGGAGSNAIFSNGGTNLFTFPESAANIHNYCYTFQSASMYIWFDMAPEDQAAFIDSLRWDVRPLTTTKEPPTFGNPRSGIEYVFGEYNKHPEGVSVWIDTSETPNHVYVYAWLD